MFVDHQVKKSSLFLNPTRTALVVLGADIFLLDRSLDHASYLNAQQQVVEHFADTERGLGIPAENIHTEFNSEAEPAEIITNVLTFLKGVHPTDLFVYACSHGFQKAIADTPRLYLTLKHSDVQSAMSDTSRATERLANTCLDFNDLIRNIQVQGHGKRAWYMVDCCASGVLHQDSKSMNVGDTAPASWEGLTFITANQRHLPGDVLAGHALPPFTEALLEVLQKGIPAPSEPLISFQRLHDEIRKRLPAILTRLELDPDLSDSSYAPDFSDRNAPLSKVRIFQNNDASHRAVHEEMALARTNAIQSSNKEAENIKLLDAVKSLTKRNKDLETTIKSLRETKGKLESTIQTSRATVERLEKEIKEHRSVNEELAKRHADSARHAAHLEEQLDQSKTRIEELANLNEELKERHADSARHAAHLEEQLDQSKTRIEELANLDEELKGRHESHLKSLRRGAWLLGTLVLLMAVYLTWWSLR